MVLAGYVVLGMIGRWSEGGRHGSRPRLRLAGWITFLGALLAYLGLPDHLRESS